MTRRQRSPVCNIMSVELRLRPWNKTNTRVNLVFKSNFSDSWCAVGVGDLYRVL